MVKLAILIFAYLAIAPLVGLIARRAAFAWMRPALFFGMILLTGLPEDIWTVTPGNILWYRGHISGYYFSLQTMAAIALFIASWSGIRSLRGTGLFLLIYALWLGAGCLSIIGAQSIDLGLMALFKYSQLVFVYVAAFLFFREFGARAILIMATALAIGLCVQVPFVLTQTFTQENRPWGVFVHSNNLGMWAYMAAIPLLAHALSRSNNWRHALPWLIATGAGAIAILLSISRAAIAVFALAVILLIVAYGIHSKSRRAVIAMAILAVFMSGGVFLAGPKITERFRDGDYLGESDLRTALNESGAAMFNDHPARGVGWNNFALLNSRPYPDYSPIIEDWHFKINHHPFDPRYFRQNPLPESVWWLGLAETGIPGGFTTALLIGYSFLLIIRAAFCSEKSDPWRWLFIGIAVTTAFVCAHTFIERILMVVTPVTTLWLVFTAAALAKYLPAPDR